jgi:hypothetical protein
VFLKTIPHLDRDGLISGETLWADVMPRRMEMAAQINDLVAELINSGLIIEYTDDSDEQVLYFPGFKNNQTRRTYKRESPSRFGPPPGYIRNTDGLEQVATAAQQNRDLSATKVCPKVEVKVKDQGEVKGHLREPELAIVNADLPTAINARATAPTPQNHNHQTEYIPGYPMPQKRQEQVTADVYMEQARRLGILPAEFTCRIELLATHTGQRSYIDAAEEDNGTLNSLKAGIIALHKLNVETADNYQACAESFAQHNDWMSDPTPTVNQFIKHAGQIKDDSLKKPSAKSSGLKVNRDGFYDFPNFKAYKAALADNPDISGQCTVKGTLI